VGSTGTSTISSTTTTPLTTTTIPVNNGLVAYYPFDGNANDASGNGHHGTIHGNPQFVEGILGTGLKFDGIGDYITVDDFFFNRTNNTVSLWVKASRAIKYQELISKHIQALDCELLLRIEKDGKYDVNTNIGGRFYALTCLEPPWCNDEVGLQYPFYDKYDFIVQTYDGSQFKFYINGELIKQFNVTGNLLDNNLKMTIGAYAGNPSTGNLEGEIDEIRIYDHALSDTEIQQLYNATPTLISLSFFDASSKANKVILEWLTESEIDNAGFNLYRSDNENGEYININNSLITAKGSSTEGASYEFIDTNVQNRKTYYYKLEDIDLSGKSTMHGPVKATPRWIFGIGR
jgi:hypothetical protein